MRLKNIPGAQEAVEAHPLVIQTPEQYKGQWMKKLFKADKPLFLEIGMGKGRFITELAEKNQNRAYIGIEKYSSVLFRALEKRDALEEPLSNLYYLRFDAEYITDIFAEGEVQGIYLNFSDPWPKDRHHKRRLTSREFLSRYEKILTPGGIVEFKTDNEKLFDFSLEEAEAAGWEVLSVTRNLHKDPEMNRDNIMTEYEERFTILGDPIYKLIMRKGKL